MTRSSHARVDFVAGLRLAISRSNAMTFASFHSSGPMTPSMVGGVLHGDDGTVFGNGSARRVCVTRSARMAAVRAVMASLRKVHLSRNRRWAARYRSFFHTGHVCPPESMCQTCGTFFSV